MSAVPLLMMIHSMGVTRSANRSFSGSDGATLSLETKQEAWDEADHESNVMLAQSVGSVIAVCGAVGAVGAALVTGGAIVPIFAAAAIGAGLSAAVTVPVATGAALAARLFDPRPK